MSYNVEDFTIGRFDPIKFIEKNYSGQARDQMKNVVYTTNLKRDNDLYLKILENKNTLDTWNLHSFKALVYFEPVLIYNSSLLGGSSGLIECHHLTKRPQTLVSYNKEQNSIQTQISLLEFAKLLKDKDKDPIDVKKPKLVDGDIRLRVGPEKRFYHPITRALDRSRTVPVQLAECRSFLLPRELIDTESYPAVLLDTEFKEIFERVLEAQEYFFAFNKVINVLNFQPPMILNFLYWKGLLDRVYDSIKKEGS